MSGIGPGDDAVLLHVKDPACKRYVFDAYENATRKVPIVGTSIRFDSSVFCAQWGTEAVRRVFDAYERGAITDIVINQRLIDIARGCLGGRWTADGFVRYRYSLAAQTKRHLGRDRNKGADTWQLRYGELIDTPVHEWPRAAREYPILDVTDPLEIFEDYQRPTKLLVDDRERAYADFALYLMTCRGIVTDPVACKKLIEATEKEIEIARARCIRSGLIVESTGKKSIKAARERLLKVLDIEPKRLARAVGVNNKEHAKYLEWQLGKIADEHGISATRAKKLLRRVERVVLEKEFTSRDELVARADIDSELLKSLQSFIGRTTAVKGGIARIGDVELRVTKTGHPKVDALACMESKDKDLIAYATYTSATTLRKKAILMQRGSRGVPLQTSYVLPMATGRTSSMKSKEGSLIGDNFQNFRRNAMSVGEKGTDDYHELPEQRECIVPRPGFVLVSIDGNAAEMRGYAQNAIELGVKSELAKVLNDGRNPHLWLAAKYILEMPYTKAEKLKKAGTSREVENASQYAKIPNFALLGGAGWRAMIPYAKGMNITLSETRAQDLYKGFYSTWTEATEVKEIQSHNVHEVWSPTYHVFGRGGMKRLLDRYTVAQNHPFQERVARMMLHAMTQLARAEYLPEGKLYGSYTVLFAHDEGIFEMLASKLHEHSKVATEIFIEACNPFLPDVPMTAEPAAMLRLSKGAKTVYDERKRLIPFDANS